MPGRITYLWFYPKEPGEHLVTCAEYCGIWHSNMYGKVIVMSESEYALWYNERTEKIAAEKIAAEGRENRGSLI